jgi:UDP-N-acetylmuramyl pentapeptide phosphotransferase/UDP-N-acetylglucosamine-1-phosphate transferase
MSYLFPTQRWRWLFSAQRLLGYHRFLVQLYPAQVMGDTGSLTLGGIITVLALVVPGALLIQALCAACSH